MDGYRVNFIRIEATVIAVGATDPQRWQWEQDDGYPGGDAKTLISVRLKDNGPGMAVSEEANLCCSRVDPERSNALSMIEALLQIAWAIKDAGLDKDAASERFFGQTVSRPS